MPLFDYRCNDCGCTREVLVKSAREKVACPECGSKNVQRLLSAFAVGSGDKSPYERRTCCGADTPCDVPPCESSGVCRRDE